MHYQLTPIHCRPWLVAYLSIKLIESHYENDYGGALRRLNAITEKLESLDFDKAPGYELNSLKSGTSRMSRRGSGQARLRRSVCAAQFSERKTIRGSTNDWR